MAGNRLSIVACSDICHVSANTFIDSVTGLSNVLNAAFFAVDQINCAFCLAVIASIDRECFFCVMTGEFRSFLHEFTYDTWAIAGPGASRDSFWVYVCFYQNLSEVGTAFLYKNKVSS